MRTLAALLVLFLTACSGGSVDDDDPKALDDRPSLEQEEQRLTEVRDRVRDRLSAELGLTAWSEGTKGNAASCEGGGYSAFLPTLLLTGGVPDDRWADAVRVVEDVGAQAGFGAPEVVVDEPGEHEVVLRGTRESLLRFGTLANATLELQSGCHPAVSAPE